MVMHLLLMTIHVALAMYFYIRMTKAKDKNHLLNLLFWMAFNIGLTVFNYIQAKNKYQEKFSIEFEKHLQQYHQTVQEPSEHNQ